MKTKLTLFAILITVTLPGLAFGQLFNGMPQPTEFRFVQAYNFNTQNSSGVTAMYRLDPTASTTVTAGTSYNHTNQSLSYASWQGVRLAGNSLHVLHMANYIPNAGRSYRGHVASTLLLPGHTGAGTYQVNGHVFNYNIDGARRYLGTAGGKITPKAIVNAGATYLNGETDWVVNARLIVYGKSWLEYRYSNLTRGHQASVYIQF